MDFENNKYETNESKNDNESKAFVAQNTPIIKKQKLTELFRNKKKVLSIIAGIILIFCLVYFFIGNHKKKPLNLNEIIKNNLINKQISKIKVKELSEEKAEIFNSTHSSQWIVITSINRPNRCISRLLNISEPWKIVVVADKKTNDLYWRIFKDSVKLFYLSIEDQLKLGYNILKYIPFNSYSRKNIGYLYAIQHGAKEIYEIDDDIFFFNLYGLSHYLENYTFYAENNNSTFMVNPYCYHGHSTIWPRGYRLKDINQNSETKFRRIASRGLNLNHLIFQGLLNINPDVDSIFLKTRTNKKFSMNQFFYLIGPLTYLPGNFVPINSKNTRYLYDVFPALALPTSVSRRVCDIWRGFIIQRYSWIYNGTLIYKRPFADHLRNYHNDSLDFIEEKDLYNKLDKLLDSINIDFDPNIKHPSEFLIKLVEILIDNEILGKNDLDMYKAFIADLNSFGYNYNLNFEKKIQRDEKKFLNINSDLYYYFPKKNETILQNNKLKRNQLFRHKDTQKKYNDILLTIVYNYPFLTKSNDYMLKLYHDYFPNMIFLYPGQIENNETYVACPESHMGYYYYKCVKRIYERFPNYRGYIFLMDDNYLKVWELENLDFNIPWLNHYFYRFYEYDTLQYIRAKKVFDIHPEWRNMYRKFLRSDILAYSVSDLYYLPNEDLAKFSSMVDEWYNQRVFLETAIPTMIALLLKPKYQVFFFVALWKEGRDTVVEYLRTAESQITIHPIKFLNVTLQDVVNKYIFFMNAKDY